MPNTDKIQNSYLKYLALQSRFFHYSGLINLYAISAWLRHSNMGVTQRHYADTAFTGQETVRRPFERIPMPQVRKPE